jgi:hypothetical protein
MVTKIIDHMGMRGGAILLNRIIVICPVQSFPK